jgi:hypothetical protein
VITDRNLTEFAVVMEAARTCETLINFYRQHDITTQKTAIFEINKFYLPKKGTQTLNTTVNVLTELNTIK